ncbi:MAG: hypothetical protein ABI589_05465 [Burkholderiales bacterium]
MNTSTAHRPHGSEPLDPEPGSLPVEPDQGPVPPLAPPESEGDPVPEPKA